MQPGVVLQEVQVGVEGLVGYAWPAWGVERVALDLPNPLEGLGHVSSKRPSLEPKATTMATPQCKLLASPTNGMHFFSRALCKGQDRGDTASESITWFLQTSWASASKGKNAF